MRALENGFKSFGMEDDFATRQNHHRPEDVSLDFFLFVGKGINVLSDWPELARGFFKKCLAEARWAPS
jgi:hypothetical protein